MAEITPKEMGSVCDGVMVSTTLSSFKFHLLLLKSNRTKVWNNEVPAAVSALQGTPKKKALKKSGGWIMN